MVFFLLFSWSNERGELFFVTINATVKDSSLLRLWFEGFGFAGFVLM